MCFKFCCGTICNAFSRKKEVETSRRALKTDLRRCLTTFDLTLIGIGSTLGSGVYVLTGDIARNTAGPGITVSFLIAAVASILAGVCYAEFGARVPKAGSAYVYTYVTAGELCAFVVGWNLLLEYGIGSATVSKGLSSYLDATFDHKISKYIKEKTGTFSLLGDETFLDFFACGFSVIVTIFISLGVKNTSRLNNVCTISNIIVIVMVIAMGAFYVDTDNWKNFAPFGVNGIVSGASSCFFAFIGFDVIATSGEEASKPSRSIPVAIVGTITICFLAYFGVSAVVTMMVYYSDLIGDSALSRAFDQKGNHMAKYLVSVGALIGLTGTTVVSLMPMPRLLYSMANDGLIFRWLARINERTETPVIATIITGFLTAVMALLIKLHDLVEMVSIGTLIAYTFVVVSILLLRYHPTDVGLSKGVLSRALTPETVRTPSPKSPLLRSASDRSEGYHTAGCKTPPYYETESVVFVRLPTDRTYQIVVYCVGAGVLEITAISIILTFWLDKLSNKDPIFISLVCIMAGALVVTILIVWKQPQNQQELYFKVPFLPLLPFLSIFFNVYLMVSLNKLTWLRFAVWMTIGFAIYFGYGVFHSSEKDRSFYETIENLEKEED
ncbi:high affinity cationic amino acid transporter 1-like [Rhopilema esculentum]|uniref:high affinity cationic amino acid transporter 1-like n=1 Tax=Rhopilema esculentum TaxID=499914 RepID=UPI0031DAC68B|eukprot:gene11904-2466_t